ncbi:hypothetical protein SDRG_04114 [Saprolegnia diclina VS20]|uniref:Uncharacterized protein n=1 Tax=Saprolegnia diclina (strain VS20) TaxID=1156394 RepID=T0S0E9_SAPDV|nr:hypothetical protein SDRG_04114 [Saprolegnia diclina VS20]EQC38403.1 hypothetical protein SDRG_04114 [Saprolegnia diclina VS20]|eukprot:XP_008607995.1 hypothetical protein SDRG_04114 [Saprolegnia diclina VS20]
MALDDAMNATLQQLVDDKVLVGDTRADVARLYAFSPGYACMAPTNQDTPSMFLAHGLAKRYTPKGVDQFAKYGAHVLQQRTRPYNVVAYSNARLFPEWQFDYA